MYIYILIDAPKYLISMITRVEKNILPQAQSNSTTNSEKEAVSDDGHSSKCKVLSKYILSYCFYIHIILLIIMSIIQLRCSLVYENDCTVEDRLILYLFIISIIQIIYSSNGIFLIILSLLYEQYQCLKYFLFIHFLIHQIILIFLLIWFIIGNYLVFHIKDKVQYANSYNAQTYCNYTLYQTAFWTTIIYYILIILFSIVLVFTNIKWFIKRLKKFRNNILKDTKTLPLV